MNTEDVKNAITELAKRHESIDEVTLDDFKDAELIEWDAEELLIAYCEQQGYLINGFPTEKRSLPDDQLDEDYFCRERFYLYFDLLSLEKDDVAEIWWFYQKSFWPDWVDTKVDFPEEIKKQVESGVFYDVEL